MSRAPNAAKQLAALRALRTEGGVAAPASSDVRVRFVRTSGPDAHDPTDPTTYHAGSEWMLPRDRAEAAIAAGAAVAVDEPATPAHPAAATAADEE